MFEDLELPNLERRALREIQSEYSSRRKGYRQVGIRVRLDKRRTAKQRVMRMLAAEKRSDAAARALQASQADREDGADADVEGALDEIALEEGALDENEVRWTKKHSPIRPASPRSNASAVASRSIRTTCATSMSRSTPRKNPTPPSSASWTPRARWTR